MQLESLLDAILRARSAASVGNSLFQMLQPWGAKAIYARDCAVGPLGKDTVFSRISPLGWESIYADRRFERANYVLKASVVRAVPFAWSEVRSNSVGAREVTGALREIGIDDGIAVPIHGPMRRIGLVSLAFETLHGLSPRERKIVELAAYAAYGRMRPIDASAGENSMLSPREIDCLAYVAAGFSDATIADKLRISETTVLTHVTHARAKLGARTRAQAVATAMMRNLL